MKILNKNLIYLFTLLFLIGCSSENVNQNQDVLSLSQQDVLPKINVTVNNNPTDGEILISPYNSATPTIGSLEILDKSGNVLKYKATRGNSLNFQKWNIGNKIRYTYLEYGPAGQPLTGVGYVPGTIVVMDENLNEINRLRLLPYNGRTVNDSTDLDAHDFILLDDNHYIAEAYIETAVNNIPRELGPVPDAKVVSSVIQEVVDGQVTWEWDSTNYPELYSESVEGNAFNDSSLINDYAHLNSMVIDPKDGNLICSLRNTSQIIKIDRKSGNILWRIGNTNSDFALTADQRFYFQHDVTLTDNNQTLLVFDNGSPVTRPYTRILEFQLNEAGKTISSFKSFNAPGNIFTQYMGSVQKRGDTYFIGWGTIPRATEINYRTGEILFDMTFDNNSYRALKY